MLLTIEIILLYVLFSVIIITGTRKNPLGGLHNLPKAIQERVLELPEYKDRNLQVVSAKQRILKKLPALVILAVIFCAMIYGAGARTFLQGFLYTLILWTAVKLYVTLVLNCGWYAHNPSVWIKGTEDMKAEYQNYKFYLSSIPRSIAAGAIVSVLVGLVIVIVGG
ncbi:MAG: hypothetical protein IJZ72_09840 [Oscillospiraceae bacterium]|nr:hypothetical protein [Oscillospiraceae bacterium]